MLEFAAKRLELLHELMPAATPIGVLVNPTMPTAERQRQIVAAAGAALGIDDHGARNPHGADRCIECSPSRRLARERIDVYIVLHDLMRSTSRRSMLRHRAGDAAIADDLPMSRIRVEPAA